MEEREGTVTTADGRTLAYLERGDLDGPPILAHHGTPGSRLSRHPNDAVYEGLRVISYDRPGYGRSDRNAGRDVASAAPDAATIADALGLERFPVMGVSDGRPARISLRGAAAAAGDARRDPRGRRTVRRSRLRLPRGD